MQLPELPFPVAPVGPEGSWRYEGGVLSGAAGPRQDRFVPPTGDSLDLASDAPRLLGVPTGDFRLSARVTVGFTGDFDAGVLYVEAGEREWAKLCLERSPAEPTICSVVTRGRSDDANSFTVDGDSVWLRISRTGTAYAFHASLDGKQWTFVRHFALADDRPAGEIRVGFLVQAPVGEGCAAVFDGIEFLEGFPEDLRDGS